VADRYFVGATDDKWNKANNWSAVSGGAGGAGVPGVGDRAIFDINSPNCTVDVIVSITTLWVKNDMFQVLDMVNFAFTTSGDTTIEGGEVYLTSGTLTVTGNGKFATSLLHHNSGTVVMDKAAGTQTLTSGGQTLYNLTHSGAGTLQLVDAMSLANDLDCVAGIFQFNNQNAVIARDLYCRATIAANAVELGSGTIEVRRNVTVLRDNPFLRGSSTFRMTGTGILSLDGFNLNLYNLYLAAPTKTVTIANAVGVFCGIDVFNVFTTGSGTINQTGAYWNGIVVHYRTGGPATPIDMDAGTTYNAAGNASVVSLSYTVGGDAGTFTFKLPTSFPTSSTYVQGFRIVGSSAGNLVFKLGRSCTVNQIFQAADPSSSGGTEVVDLNGFNLTVNGNYESPPLGGSGMALNVGNSVLTVTGNLVLDWLINTGLGYYLNIGATGQATCGNFYFNRSASSTMNAQIVMAAGAVLAVTGNWDTGSVNNKALGSFLNIDLGTVRFTSAGAFTIAIQVNEKWPTVEFTGGGSTTLPNLFNCLNVNVTAGLITPGPVFTVRNLLTNNGTINFGTGTTFVGGGILNTGTLNGLATANLYLNGPLERLAGFNPVNLTMLPTCVRIQLESTMTITNFTIADRPNPGIVVYKALTTFTIGTFNSQIQAPEGCVQFVSDTPNVQYVWKATAITSMANIWPRDCDASASPTPPVGNLSNKDLGNNLGWTLNSHGFLKVITDDVGVDNLSELNIGNPIAYCWLVDTTVVGLTAKAAAFAAGAKNWHRKTGLPFAMLDNLNIGTTYYVALGIIDDRDRVVAPSVGTGDYVSLKVTANESPSSSGGGAHGIAVSSQFAMQG